jgi:hypothetical protein
MGIGFFNASNITMISSNAIFVFFQAASNSLLLELRDHIVFTFRALGGWTDTPFKLRLPNLASLSSDTDM